MLIKKYNSTLGYYCSHFLRPGYDKRHTECTSLVCGAYNVNEREYIITHSSPLPRRERVVVAAGDLMGNGVDSSHTVSRER